MKAEQGQSHHDIVITVSWDEADRLQKLLSKFEGSDNCIVPGFGGVLAKTIRIALELDW